MANKEFKDYTAVVNYAGLASTDLFLMQTDVAGLRTVKKISKSQLDTGIQALIAATNLSGLAASTSAHLAGIISDETGSGALVFGTSPTIVTPTIASFANATHTHTNAAGGGTLDAAAVASGVFNIARLATGTPDGTKFVRDDGTLAVPAGAGGSPPTGTGFYHVTAGVMDAASIGETGTANVVRATSPTIVTPTIASFVNSTHTHQNAAGGGTLDAAAIAAGTIATARLGSGSASSSTYLRGDNTWAAISGASVPSGTGFYHVTSGAMDAASIGETGTGNVVRATSPTLVTPNIGVATGTSLTLSGAAGSIVLSDGATHNATITTQTITTSYSIILPASQGVTGFLLGTVSGTNVTLSQVASTGSGSVVQATSPTLVTPVLGVATATSINGSTVPSSDTLVGRATTDTLTNKTLTSPVMTTPTLGVATATSINKVAITAPTTSATLTIADGKTATVNNSITFAGTDSTTQTFQATDTIVGRATTDTLTNKIVDHGVSMSSDDTYRGVVRTGLNNSGGVTQWDAVYLNSSSAWVLADANGTNTYPARGLAVATVATGGATTVITRGTVRNDGWAWTPGGTIFLSTTAGGLTQTAPATTADKVQVMGYALSATTMAVEIDGNYGTVA